MKLKSGGPREGFLAVCVVAHKPVHVLVATLVVLKVLLKLEVLATVGVRAFEDSVRELHEYFKI